MRPILLIVALSIITFQYVEARANYESRERSLIIQPDVRGVTDIWNNLKNSAKNALEFIKNIARNTEERMKQWIQNVKDRAQNAKEKLEERIRDVRDKSNTALKKFIGTGKLVKECVQKQREGVEELLKEIIVYVTSCIAENLNNLAHLDQRPLDVELNLNETNFITDVENKMNNCVNQNDVVECLNNVRQDIYLAMENMENKVLISRMEIRGITDDLLEAVVSCSIEGLINASNVIAAESIEIIICVVKG